MDLDGLRKTLSEMWAKEESKKKRQEINQRLDEIDIQTKKLKCYREGFKEHLTIINFELEDLKKERQLLTKELIGGSYYAEGN